jgi:glycosyltransferase involved in cell wall biosynthesis
MSRVDVIVPCYNYGHYLRECVQSVLSQEGVDVRVLIIDDCSPDNTPQVAAELMSRDSRIEYRRHEKNIGHIATYNEGLQWASGDYLILLSADDLLTPGALDRAATVLDRHPEVGLTFGGVINVPRDSKANYPAPVSTSRGYKVMSGPEFLESICVSGDNPVPTPSVIVRRTIQAQVGGYTPELPHIGDLEMWMRFALWGGAAVIEADQAFYRLHSFNMHLHFTKKPVDGFLELKKLMEWFFHEHASRLPNAERMQVLACKGLAREAFWRANRAYDLGLVEKCQELIDFALTTDPEIRLSGNWTRYQWKRRMGPRVWSALRPLVRRLRRRPCRS